MGRKIRLENGAYDSAKLLIKTLENIGKV